MKKYKFTDLCFDENGVANLPLKNGVNVCVEKVDKEDTGIEFIFCPETDNCGFRINDDDIWSGSLGEEELMQDINDLARGRLKIVGFMLQVHGKIRFTFVRDFILPKGSRFAHEELYAAFGW